MTKPELMAGIRALIEHYTGQFHSLKTLDVSTYNYVEREYHNISSDESEGDPHSLQISYYIEYKIKSEGT